MATTTIPWGDGSGDNIYLTYPSASGNQTVIVTSDANTGAARSKTVSFTAGNITQQLTVNQELNIHSIPYIRNTSLGAYINTGISPNKNTKIIVWARNFNPGCGRLLGSTNSNGDFRLEGGTGTWACCIGTYYGNKSAAASGEQDKYMCSYHKYEFGSGVLKVDDVTIVQNTGTFSASNTLPIHIFGANHGGEHSSPEKMIDICAAQIYDNGTLVRDYVAVNNTEIGLYDKVSQTLFTNDGEGSFTYGTFDISAYTPLEYITSTGGQVFDTGLYGTYDLKFMAKFSPTNTSAAWTSFMGVRVSSPANSCDVSLGTATSGQDNSKIYWRFGANTTSAQAYNGNASSRLTNKNIIVVKDAAKLTVYESHNQRGSNTKSGVSSSFTTTVTIAISGYNYGSGYNNSFIGKIFYVGFENTMNLVPAIVNNIVGMYDTYGERFFSSETSTPFVAGPEL